MREKHEIGIADSGGTFAYPVGSRLDVVLTQHVHPPERLDVDCRPANTLSQYAGPPPSGPSLWSVQFEAVAPGTCRIEDNDFRIVVVVVEGQP